MAYFWAKEAYRPFHVSLDYRTLTPVEQFTGSLWVSRDDCAAPLPAGVRWEVLTMAGRVLCSGAAEVTLPGVHSTKCLDICFPVPREPVYALRVSAQRAGDRDSNLYFFSTRQQMPYRPYLELPAPVLQAVKAESTHSAETWEITNTGPAAALHIHCMERTDQWIILPEEDFFTLFPGQSRRVTVRFRKRFNYGFDEYPTPTQTDGPVLEFYPFPLTRLLP